MAEGLAQANISERRTKRKHGSWRYPVGYAGLDDSGMSSKDSEGKGLAVPPLGKGVKGPRGW